jgi:UDP-glucose 4-epimerase
VPEPTALVTGAHGFIGRHVARALARRGQRVLGIGHGSWSREEWRAWGLGDWRTSDVDLEALQVHGGDPERIVHCAGSASVGFSMAHPAQDFRRTVDSTLAVLEFVRSRGGATRVVLVSSGSVYGSREGPVAEDAPTAPESAYAAHKLVAEQLLSEYGRLFGVPGAVVRLFSVYGAGLRKQLLWDACGRLGGGEAAFGGTGRETRDWLAVEDAAELLALAADRADRAVPVVKGGTGVGASVAEVLEELGRALGGRGRPVFTGAARAGDPARFVADPSRARAWGWAPRVAWREGVAAYARWYAQGAP